MPVNMSANAATHNYPTSLHQWNRSDPNQLETLKEKYL